MARYPRPQPFLGSPSVANEAADLYWPAIYEVAKRVSVSSGTPNNSKVKVLSGLGFTADLEDAAKEPDR